MAIYKEGERVRIISGYGSYHDFPRGSIVRIVGVFKNHLMDEPRWVCEDEVEHTQFIKLGQIQKLDLPMPPMVLNFDVKTKPSGITKWLADHPIKIKKPRKKRKK